MVDRSQNTTRYIVAAIAISLLGFGLVCYTRQYLNISRIFIVHFNFYDYWALMLLPVLFAALFFLDFRWTANVLNITNHTGWLALILGGLLTVGHFVIYKARPYIVDEFLFDFQAKIFANGQMVGDWPYDLRNLLLHSYYHNHHFVLFPEGDVFARFWPGQALLRVPFELFGAQWLLNVGLAIGCLFSVKYICKEIFGEKSRAGAWAILFLLASPSFLINAMSFYPNTFYVFSSLTFSALLLKPTYPRIFYAGLLGSIAIVQHQPMSHALYAIPWYFWLLRQDKGVRRASLLFISYVPVVLLIGFGWALWMFEIGSPDHQGGVPNNLYEMLFNFPVEVSFWRRPFLRLIAFYRMWSWAAPGLALIAAIGVFTSEKKSPTRYFAYSAISVVIGYFFIHTDSGHGWGYRYFEGGWSALIILGAAGTLYFKSKTDENQISLMQRKIMLSVLLGLFFCVPLRLFQVETIISSELKDAPQFEDNQTIEIGFVNINEAVIWNNSEYRKYDLVQNDPFLRSPKIIFEGKGFHWNDVIMQRTFPNFIMYENDKSRYYLPKEKEADPFILTPGERTILHRVRY